MTDVMKVYSYTKIADICYIAYYVTRKNNWQYQNHKVNKTLALKCIFVVLKYCTRLTKDKTKQVHLFIK